MNLHPDDAMVVLEKGWGERHPLARGGWMKQYVPREFTSKFSNPRFFLTFFRKVQELQMKVQRIYACPKKDTSVYSHSWFPSNLFPSRAHLRAQK